LAFGRFCMLADLKSGWYKFVFVNGANARAFTLSANGLSFVLIGTGQAKLPNAVAVTEITLLPGERREVLVDFSSFPIGTRINLTNTAQYLLSTLQFPFCGPTKQFQGLFLLLSFRLFQNIDRFFRSVTLLEVADDDDNPTSVMINGLDYMKDATELPIYGSVETWDLINMSGDAHPIHIHLISFQLVHRQDFEVGAYTEAFNAANGNPPLSRAPSVPGAGLFRMFCLFCQFRFPIIQTGLFWEIPSLLRPKSKDGSTPSLFLPAE
jgi:spore coat protein A, manganese oxidase